MPAETIQTDKISKFYRDVRAVTDLSIHVRKGEIYGFLGLNGAGKTTTIRMLLGLIRPTSGSAYLNGIKISTHRPDLWQQVGALVEIPYAYPELTVRENLEVFRRLHQLKDKSAVDKIIESLQLGPYADRKARNLSLGNKQRLGLARAFIHNPQILILDEPTNGLDPAGIYEIREMLTDLAANHGVTIFISSHILAEISRFSTRIGIIHEGLLIREINAGELETLCRKRLVVSSSDPDKAFALLSQNGFDIVKDKDLLKLSETHALQNPDRIATLMVNSGCPPTLLKVEEEDLEAFFLRTIGMKGEVQ
jgi:ABC-2 type transport system ATP-binding protein